LDLDVILHLGIIRRICRYYFEVVLLRMKRGVNGVYFLKLLYWNNIPILGIWWDS
jgi:hypothetical protein